MQWLEWNMTIRDSLPDPLSAFMNIPASASTKPLHGAVPCRSVAGACNFPVSVRWTWHAPVPMAASAVGGPPYSGKALSRSV